METVIKTEKQCNKCGRVLPIDSFHIYRKNRDGHTSICKSCRSVSASRQNNNLGVNPKLSDFTSRDLIMELRSRGYRGELNYVQKITV